MPDKKIVWLETGNEYAGLEHIIKDHGAEFEAIGVTNSDIPKVLIDALSQGQIVGTQGDRSIYRVKVDGKAYGVAISIGSNGFIVGANMKGHLP